MINDLFWLNLNEVGLMSPSQHAHLSDEKGVLSALPV